LQPAKDLPENGDALLLTYWQSACHPGIQTGTGYVKQDAVYKPLKRHASVFSPNGMRKNSNRPNGVTNITAVFTTSAAATGT
jgi:hypothetical protein